MPSTSNTVTKQSIVNRISENTGLTIKDSSELVDIILGEITQSLANNDDVLITGFGKFEVTSKKSRIGRNPLNGEPVTIPARRVMKFKPSDLLKEGVSKAAVDRLT